MSDKTSVNNTNEEKVLADNQTSTNDVAISKLLADNQEYLAGWQRAKADYVNLKKETDQKQLELIKFANMELIKELLPLVDYFKHAFKAVPESDRGSNWLEGIRHIQSRLEQILAYHGVKEMEVVGEKFDPNFHDAIGEIENSGYESGLIAEEVRTGFMWHDKVLQPARVKVAK